MQTASLANLQLRGCWFERLNGVQIKDLGDPEVPAPRQRALSFVSLLCSHPYIPAAPQTQRSSHSASRPRRHLSPLQGHSPLDPLLLQARPQVLLLTWTAAAADSSAGPGTRQAGLHLRLPQELWLRARPRRLARSAPARRLDRGGRGCRTGCGRGGAGAGRNLGRLELSKPGCTRGGGRPGGDCEQPGEGVQRFPWEHDAGGD